MAIVDVKIRCMTTSREDDTKYEHFVVLINNEGECLDYYMSTIPSRAVYMATEFAQFAGLEMKPYYHLNELVELDEIEKFMLEK